MSHPLVAARIPRRVVTLLLVLVFCSFGPTRDAAEAPEVRQLVTFKFEPGMTSRAVKIFAEALLPVYKDAPALLRFRGYLEAESPDPFDLIVVSSFKGMAGMDALNAQLAQARPAGPRVRELYGQLADLSAFHHDQFIEMIDNLAVAKTPSHLQVFESVRIVPGGRLDFERLIASAVVPWERSFASIRTSETARFLISDGWDYLRILGIDSLADQHAYISAAGAQAFARRLDALVVARKRIVVREDPALSVR